MTVEDIKRQNIKAVLREASRLFSEVGVDRTSVGQVAECSGVTRRSVLNYFESKNALIIAVQEEYLRSSGEALREYVDSVEFQALNGLDQFLGILSFVFAALKEQYRIANNLTEMTAILRHDPELEGSKNDFSLAVTLMSSRLEPAYRKGVEDGSIHADGAVNPVDVEMVTLLARGLYRQLAYLLDHGSDDDTANVDRLIGSFLALIRRILQA